MMFRAVWPTLDPAAETDASFWAAVRAIPKSVRRRFGFGVLTEFDQVDDDRRREFLDAYTNFDGAPYAGSD
jgi:hypothetical protein